MAGGDAALVPTGREMKSYAPLRSLGRRGIHTIVASERERLPHFSSRYCSERVQLPSPTADLAGYRDALLEVAARPAVKTAYPVRECDAYLFAKYRDAFEEHLSLVALDLDTLRRGHDRLRLARAAEAAGVPYAETRPLSAVDAWDRPVVVKSRYNVLTGDYVDAYPDGELEEVKRVQTLAAGEEPDAEALYAEMNHEPIVQDFVPQADKHLYCALWDEGEPLATYQHRQLRQNSWVGGGGVYRVSAYSQAVEEAAFDLLSHLDWHGFACIEYVQDADTGEWKFLEINPRVWQSFTEALRAGADFANYYWLRSQGRPEEIDPSYEMGVASHIAYGEAGHLLSVLRDESPFDEPPSFLRTLGEIVASCIAEPRFDYVRRDDPRLFLSAVRETLSTGGVTSSRQYDVGGDQFPPSPANDAGQRQ
jgi:predicted ATP-grasp superfamily ATP-dependent carboligase